MNTPSFDSGLYVIDRLTWLIDSGDNSRSRMMVCVVFVDSRGSRSVLEKSEC